MIVNVWAVDGVREFDKESSASACEVFGVFKSGGFSPGNGVSEGGSFFLKGRAVGLWGVDFLDGYDVSSTSKGEAEGWRKTSET